MYWLQLEEDVCPEGMKRGEMGRILGEISRFKGGLRRNIY